MNLLTIRRMVLVLIACFGVASAAHAQRTVTLRLNTATIPDTVDVGDLVEVRGALGGQAPATLPDGNVINWGPESTLEPTNVGGDFWEVSFEIPDDTNLEFKFWNALGEWEDGGNHTVPPGTGDTTLTLHYFIKGDGQAYDWRPWTPKDDSVAVHYRVYMATESAVGKGFIAGSDDFRVGVRGDGLGGASPLDWGATRFFLEQESQNPDANGYFLYSATAFYPTSAAGTEQPYKFFLEGAPSGWEDNVAGNRTFVVPSQDTTLQWVYYDNAAPADVPTSDTRKEALVTFTIDVGPLESAGLFNPARGDSIQVRGAFNGWNDSDPDRSRLRTNIFNPAIWENQIALKDTTGAPQFYKFYLDQNLAEGETSVASWEEPLDFGGGDRVFTFTGNDFDLGTGFYNNIRAGNVIPAGTTVDVTFRADMNPATGFSVAFDPATDSVRVSIEDGIWQGIQAVNKDVSADSVKYIHLTDADGDLVYEGTVSVVGPTYNGIGYRLQYGTMDDGWNNEVGDREGKPGRRRYQYILPNTDGSFAADYTLPVVPAQEQFPLPFECNPTLSDAQLAALPQNVRAACYTAGTSPVALDVDVVDAELPTSLTLGQNYPNPFNPTTTFEYALTRSEHVTVRVFDVTGRVVATLVDGVQAPSTYRVTFDAAALPSGVYLYQLQTASQTIAKKMLLMK